MLALRVLGYLWSLPLVLVGLLLALLYRPTSWRWSEGCLEAIVAGDRMIGKPGAQTHGWVIYYRDELARQSARLRRHERVHVRDGLLGGVFYGLAYAFTFAWWFVFVPAVPLGWPRWKRAYYRNWFEQRARLAENPDSTHAHSS